MARRVLFLMLGLSMCCWIACAAAWCAAAAVEAYLLNSECLGLLADGLANHRGRLGVAAVGTYAAQLF